ncbi:MAG TPA: hypothetical protein VLH81_04760, partial [Desulfobacterales bacterium]|nr:hypothetical protein [Desulfobacterales bacterium]
MKPSRVAVFLCIIIATPLAAQVTDLAAARAETDVRWGVLAWHRGAFNDAVLSFERAIGIDPTSSRGLDWLGRALLR